MNVNIKSKYVNIPLYVLTITEGYSSSIGPRYGNSEAATRKNFHIFMPKGFQGSTPA